MLLFNFKTSRQQTFAVFKVVLNASQPSLLIASHHKYLWIFSKENICFKIHYEGQGSN